MSAKLGNRLKYCEIIQPVSVVRHPSCVCDTAHVPSLDLLLVVREHFVKISNTEQISLGGLSPSVSRKVTLYRWRSTRRLPATSTRTSYRRKDAIFINLGPIFIAQFRFYQPLRSWAKVMFLQVCVCPQGGGYLPQCKLGC